MNGWTILKKAISDVIKENGNHNITGAVLQNTLNNIVSQLGQYGVFAGVATPATNPGIHDGPVFYLASEPGIYSNFNGVTVLKNTVTVLHNLNTNWQAEIAINISNISSLEAIIYGPEADRAPLTLGSQKTGKFYYVTSANTVIENESSGSKYYSPITITKSGTICIELSGYGSNSSRDCAVVNPQGVVTSWSRENNPSEVNGTTAKYYLQVTEGDKLYVSFAGATNLSSVTYLGGLSNKISTLESTLTQTGANLQNEIAETNKAIAKLNTDIYGETTIIPLTLGSQKTGKFYYVTSANTMIKNENASSKYYDPITITKSGTICIELSDYSSNSSRDCVVINSQGAVTSWSRENDPSEVNGTTAKYYLQVTEGDKLYVSFAGATNLSSVILSAYNSPFDKIDSNTIAIDKISDIIYGSEADRAPLTLGSQKTGKFYYVTSINTMVENENASSKYYDPITITKSGTICIELSGYGSNSSRDCVVINSQGAVTSWSRENDPSEVNGTTAKYYLQVTEGDKLYVSFAGATNLNSITYLAGVQALLNSQGGTSGIYTIFISPTGNDNNAGTLSSPKATLESALSLSPDEIVCLPGSYYNQKIKVSLSKKPYIKVRAYSGDRVIFKNGTNLNINGKETKVSGYTKVYSAPCSTSISRKYLFQDSTDDISTEISSTERMPHQRGKFYRCDCTKIEKCSADSLNSALQEIESSLVYKYYWSGNTLYFSRPASSSGNPIFMPISDPFIQGATKEHSIELLSLEMRYMSLNLHGFGAAKIVDTAVKYVVGAGCICWDNSTNVELIRCEAASCFMDTSTTGDGFNAHSDMTISSDLSAKRATAMLIECWSHDNADDGYSDHEGCEVTIIGGLFEYNGKAGITPSYGTHCTCHDVYSRCNYTGFYYTGAQIDNGNGGQLICYNCVAENNTRGGQKCGFRIDSNTNTAILINCKSINNAYGYYASSGKMILLDCRAKNNTSGAKYQSSNSIQIINTDAVE